MERYKIVALDIWVRFPIVQPSFICGCKLTVNGEFWELVSGVQLPLPAPIRSASPIGRGTSLRN